MLWSVRHGGARSTAAPFALLAVLSACSFPDFKFGSSGLGDAGSADAAPEADPCTYPADDAANATACGWLDAMPDVDVPEVADETDAAEEPMPVDAADATADVREAAVDAGADGPRETTTDAIAEETSPVDTGPGDVRDVEVVEAAREAAVDAGPLFFEDFEAGATRWTPNVITDWSIITDGANKVYGEATSSVMVHASSAGDVAWTDQVIEAKIRIVRFGAQSNLSLGGVFARFRDVSNFYYLALDGAGRLSIRKLVAGTSTIIQTTATGTITPNLWYSVRFEVKGSTLNGFLYAPVDAGAGLLQTVTATDTSFTSGKVAVGTNNASAQFDDVRVTAP